MDSHQDNENDKVSSLLEKVDEVDSEELAKKRADYYTKWRSVAREETSKTKQEEEKDKEMATEKLGINKGPKSEAEKKDMEKRAALREAKKQWEGKQAKDESQRMVIKDEKDVVRTLNMADVDHRPVLVIANASKCEYVLSENLHAIIKIFIDNCKDTTVTIKCGIITQHVEVSHCKRFHLVLAIPLQTIQCDLCEDLKITYNQNCMLPGHRVYHAGVKKLEVEHWTHGKITHDYENFSAPEFESDQTTPNQEWQYITHNVNDQLKTERVRHAHGIMPLTEEELSKVTGTEEIDQAHVRQANAKKTGGNEAFKNGEMYQAAVFYTQAMDLAPGNIDLLCTCLCNRAACNLKLGRLEEALNDANACLELDDTRAKAWFRKGMALHAMKMYGPAIAALSKANDLEPKNKQIMEAIGFAKVLLNKQLKEAEDERKS